QRNSQVLLLLEIDAKKTQGILPGKLFEYLNARRPILAIGPEGWEAAKIVEQTKSGMALTPQQMTDLKNVLLKWFSEFQSQGLKIQSEDIEKYSRRELTASLAKILTWELS
ncbi:MAG: glycosyl transferase family 1, partial [Croceitalea sp.]|nr:glycosyl transferase family 1 [Croceitalea sp.]